MTPPPLSSSFQPRKKDWGRALTQLLCALFALLGALPLSAGFIARTELARDWA
ncbi:MAG: hypothetical protein RJA70_1793, partial [Pseudomonadota bacterium]